MDNIHYDYSPQAAERQADTLYNTVAELHRETGHPLYLLFDPVLRLEHIDTPLMQALVRRQPAPVPLPHQSLSEPDYPWLVPLDLNQEYDQALLRLSISVALEELHPDALEQGLGRAICGWLTSPAKPEDMIKQLGHTAIQRTGINRHILMRYYDPAVHNLLWTLLSELQQRRMGGMLSGWIYPDGDGQVVIRRFQPAPMLYSTFSLGLNDKQCDFILYTSGVNRLDSFSNLIYKTLFARDAGIAMYDIEEDIGRQMATGPEGAWARRRAMWGKRVQARTNSARSYFSASSQHLLSTEGKKTIEISRIKLLGTILSIWEFYSQSKELIAEGEGSASDFMSVGLFAASFGIQTALPAMNTVVEVSTKSYPLSVDRAKARLLKWSIRANACGSMAAGLMVISDFGALGESFTKDGSIHWKGVGLASAKIVSDSAYTIQSSEELLRLLGKRGIVTILTYLAASGPATSTKAALSAITLRGITIFASWQVMTLIILAQVAIAVFSDNDLQNWCEQCVFGTAPCISNTEKMTVGQRTELTQEQEDQLVKALHETLGLPLTKRVKQQEKIEQLTQLKAENTAFQHMHN
jgi:hypothetical protein